MYGQSILPSIVRARPITLSLIIYPGVCLFLALVLQAFNMIDQNRDGFIDNDDLKDMLASLGQAWVRPVGSPSYLYTSSKP